MAWASVPSQPVISRSVSAVGKCQRVDVTGDDRWLQPSTDSTPRFYTLYVAFVAAIGGFLFGYDLVIISGAQIFLRQQFALTPEQLGFATSSALFGCIGGPFF